MRIDQATSTTIADFWNDVESTVEQCDTLNAAAQELARRLYEQFQESVLLARVFVTVPFSSLPAWDQIFVRGLAVSVGAKGEVKPETTVLSLVGTWGQESEWCNRRHSKGHAGIPLISSNFVAGIPMIARLLKELGISIDCLDKGDKSIVVETTGSSVGLFFVEDAAGATDDAGRKIISAQDFVATHGAKSVFGASAAYAEGPMIVIVVFCRDMLSRTLAENFSKLATLFRSGTSSLVKDSDIFAHDE